MCCLSGNALARGVNPDRNIIGATILIDPIGKPLRRRWWLSLNFDPLPPPSPGSIGYSNASGAV
jgi:hypothetical protein